MTDVENVEYTPLGVDRTSLLEGEKRTKRNRKIIAAVSAGLALFVVAAAITAYGATRVNNGGTASETSTQAKAAQTLYSEMPRSVKGVAAEGSSWTVAHSPDSTEEVTVVLGLKMKNKEALETLFNTVSDPKSDNYGKYLSQTQLKDLVHNAEGLKRVTDWLDAFGVKYTVSPLGDYVSMKTTAAMAEHMLSTKVAVFKNSATGATDVASTRDFSVPAVLAGDIDMIAGATTLPSPIAPRPVPRPAPKIRAMTSSSMDEQTTPAFLNRVYNIKSNKVANKQATQSLFESLGQQYSPADLKAFAKEFNLGDLKISKQVGDNDPSECTRNPDNCGEANLDVQYMMAVADAPTTYWSMPADEEPFLEWIQNVAATENPPLVHSISYGGPEHLMDPSQMKKFDEAAMKLGVRGVTVVVSSGDDGVPGFEARRGKQYCGFYPGFPASSPYVLSVGATQFLSGEEEVAQSSLTGGRITTGGGFSGVFSAPSYQKKAIKNYFDVASNLPNLKDFASSGRGYPDIALSGHSYQVFVGGQMAPVDGTSASAPVMGALLTLVNGERLSAGKKPVGFVNPLLYSLYESNPEVFHDVTKGQNNCAALAEVCCDQGFHAAKGWDPLTGLGSVNFDALKDLMVKA